MVRLSKKFLSLVAILALSMPSMANAAPEVEFNYQSVYTGPHVFNVNTAEPWAKDLINKSNGEMAAYFFMEASLVKTHDVVPSIMSGTLDMTSSGLVYEASKFPLGQHIGLPFVYDDAIHSTAIANKVYETNPEVKAEFDKVGKVLNMWGGDRSAFFSTVGPITSPEDLKGKRVLIWSGKQVDQIKAWGGIPVQVVPSDTYLGLQRGMGEVFFGPMPVGVANKIMEVAKDVTPINALMGVIVTWASWDLWDYLSPEQQKVLVETTKDWGTKTGADLVAGTNRDIETMKANGCTFHQMTPEAFKQFQELDEPVSLAYIQKEFDRLGVKRSAKEWHDYIMQISEETRVQK